MKITLLIDNEAHPQQARLHHEHGLSMYFQADGLHWLLDTGNSPLFIENAQKLGIKLEDIDYVFLSHGHKDHTGGIEAFLQINSKATVLISEQVRHKKYYSYRHESPRDITLQHQVLEQYAPRVRYIKQSQWLSDKLALVTHLPQNHPQPRANSTLYAQDGDGKRLPDTFDHEMALAVKEGDGLIVFSGCAHNGLLNTIEACSAYCKTNKIKACIGGAHLPNKTESSAWELNEEIRDLGRGLLKTYPAMQLITGHCTGKHAQGLLKEVMQQQVQTFYSGCTLEV